MGLPIGISIANEEISGNSALVDLAIGLGCGVLFLNPTNSSFAQVINSVVELEDQLDAQALYVGANFRNP